MPTKIEPTHCAHLIRQTADEEVRDRRKQRSSIHIGVDRRLFLLETNVAAVNMACNNHSK